jgi:hypothetical protein
MAYPTRQRARRVTPNRLCAIGCWDGVSVWEAQAYRPPSNSLSHSGDLRLIHSRASSSVLKLPISTVVPFGGVAWTHHPLPPFISAGSKSILGLKWATIALCGIGGEATRTKFGRYKLAATLPPSPRKRGCACGESTYGASAPAQAARIAAAVRNDFVDGLLLSSAIDLSRSSAILPRPHTGFSLALDTFALLRVF